MKCIELGGDLASIGTKVEFEVMKKLLASYSDNWYLWTGLNDNEAEGAFVWSDGTKNVEVNFAAGHPDGGESENCAYIWAKRFELYDMNCNSEIFYLCKLK